MPKGKLTQTSRILSVYHLFANCQEVSFAEIIGPMPVSKKTVRRDILTLEDAGVLRVRYSKKRAAFLPVSREVQPITEENAVRRRYLVRLQRLCILMDGLREMWSYADGMPPAEKPNPLDWYRERFPRVSDRTRQRDFAELRKLGYEIYYEPAFWDDPGYYHFYFPGTYGLDTFEDTGGCI